MVGHGCITGTLEGTDGYSSPVPWIGLYIATASAVCMFLIIYDIFHAILRRKSWLPCKTFKLNSVTLTLLSVVLKLPVDLTTSMPSALDQLSKLTATTLLCVYMSYVMPSLGIMKDTTNMFALSILVITVFVNMCIQMSTGVIFLLFPEHIMILCLMLVLVSVLWSSAKDTSDLNEVSKEVNEEFGRRGIDNMMQRVKICYLHGYNSNPQFLACKHPSSATIGVLTLLSVVVVLQAALRCLILKTEKFCSGTSDYDWSMWAIVVVQLLAITIGSSATCFRSFRMFYHIQRRWLHEPPLSTVEPFKFNLLFPGKPIDVCGNMFDSLNRKAVFLIHKFVMIPPLAALSILRATLKKLSCDNVPKHNNEYKKTISEYQELMKETSYLIKLSDNHKVFNLDEWEMLKGLQDMERWIKESEREPNHIYRLLSRVLPSQNSYGRIQNGPLDAEDILREDRHSVLTVVLLVRIAQITIPKSICKPLVMCFLEAYEIVCFIYEKLAPASQKFFAAKVVWKSPNSNPLVPLLISRLTGDPFENELDRAIKIVTGLFDTTASGIICFEANKIRRFITRQSYSSIDHLYASIENAFVWKLHSILLRLPEAIIRTLIESPVEEYHDQVRLALKFLCKLQSLGTLVQWDSFDGIYGMTTAKVTAASERQCDRLEEDIAAATGAVLTSAEYGPNIHDNVIVEITGSSSTMHPK